MIKLLRNRKMKEEQQVVQLERALDKGVNEGVWGDLLKMFEQGTCDFHQLTTVLNTAERIEKLKKEMMFPEEGFPYGRKILQEDDCGEVLLVQWAADTFCAIHDHGKGDAIIFFIEGSYVEEFWQWRDDRVERLSEHRREPQTHCSIKAGELHRVKCLGKGMSLHFYVPSSGGMRIFDTEKQRTLWVKDDCGAWIDSTKIIKEKVWDAQ